MTFSLLMILFVASFLMVWWYYLLVPKAIATTTTTISTSSWRTNRRGVTLKTYRRRGGGEIEAPAEIERDAEDVVKAAGKGHTAARLLTIFSTYPPTPVENAICEQFITDELYYPICLKIIKNCLRMGKRITLSPRNVPGCF